MSDHPYECLAKGHEGGDTTFYAAPPDWFAAKDMSPPKNCPACRAWIKSQTDEMKSCVSCGSKIRITALYKISYFKKIGPYEPITECRSCQDGNRPEKGTKKRPEKEERKTRRRRKQEREFKDLRIDTPPLSRVVVTDVRHYDRQIVRNYKLGVPETRTQHLEHHLLGSANAWTDAETAAALGLSRPASPTSFAAEGQTVEELLEFTAGYALSTSDEHVREYMIGNGRIARVTYTGDHDGLEKTVLTKLDDGTYELVTTHDNVTVEDVMGQTWYKGS